eukprot:CAMPEP_0174298254 /NCGR_PEP_ID=MMETSP0809-20121228/53241_1 /TAXON_ID=73025 ORGANISM="Eutreptiella gymnastica-like, Strain CCMP1594" /NCGR_SAMPLE_ID=MMETSP0809 /ASSEMBLY_ACC=CAM_ASM_000658 /LENGTH=49 /DNA_ID= /DNA_START= /DNA_END= /DNA_ORIENTATION=
MNPLLAPHLNPTACGGAVQGHWRTSGNGSVVEVWHSTMKCWPHGIHGGR